MSSESPETVTDDGTEYVPVERYEREMAEMRALVEALRKQVTSDEGDASESPGRNEKVLARLNVGDSVTRSEVVALYRRETDISNEKTAARRLKGLVETGYLKASGMGRFEVVEVPGDE